MYWIRVVVGTALLLISAVPGLAKCANRFIYLDGRIVGPISKGLRVIAQVAPDPNWEPQPEIEIDNGRISGTVYFDATKSEGRVRDNCSRVPEIVEIVLLKGGHEVDCVRLEIGRDYIKTTMGDYKPRAPFTLHSQ